MTTLYKLPGKAMQTLKLATGGGPSQSTVSLLPTIMATLLDRLANPSPTHHAFRAPFIRPLLNKNASKQPIFNLLTPAIAPRPQDLEPDSPEQARLIEFFEEKKENLLRNTSIDQTLPPSIYCTHKKDLIGPPKLLFNETYNIALTKASKHTAIIHAVSVISHQLSLMLQAMVGTSSRCKEYSCIFGANHLSFRRTKYSQSKYRESLTLIVIESMAFSMLLKEPPGPTSKWRVCTWSLIEPVHHFSLTI
jgi:hypothetical protein